MAKQDVTAELFYDADWHDITADTYARDPIAITRGRGDEMSTTPPAAASMTLDNRDGTYNPRNPASALFGVAGRNTPIRLHLGVPHPAAASSSLSASTSHIAPSVTAPTSSGILVCGWSGPFPSGSYTAPGGMTESLDQNDAVQTMMVARQVISGAGATGTKTATASTSETYLSCSVLIHGPTSITTGALGGSTSLTIDGNQGDWWVLYSSFGWDATDAAPPAFPWDTDGGGWVLLADTGTVNSGDSDAAFNRMKVWAKQIKTTDAAHHIELSTDVDSTISWLTRVPAAEIDSVWGMRAHGEVASWAPRRAIKGDAWTNVAVGGPLRRLGQGRDPLRSALRRYIATLSPVAYWACDEGTASNRVALTAGTGGPLYVNFGDGTFEPGAGEMAPWSGRGALVRGDVSLDARVIGMSATPTQVTLDMLVKGDQAVGGDVFSFNLVGPLEDGGIDSWQIDMYPSLTEIDIFEPGAGSNASAGYAGLFDGNGQRHIRFTALQNGAAIDYTLYFNGELVVTDTVAATTLAPIRRIFISPGGDGVGLSDVAVWSGTPPTLADYYDAATGHAGEMAGRRFLRLCAEEGITPAIAGDPDDTQPMGPQFPDTLLNLFREIEVTDDGFVHDAREFRGLTMRTGRSCYNQAPALTIDYDAFELAPPTDPVVDDLNIRNDVTVTRRSGGSARAVRESGPNNVNDPEDDPEGVGRYTHQHDGNPFSDLVLPDVASWHLHRGTVTETRWPAVTVDLDATPDLAGPVSAVDVGDRIVIENMPADLSPDPVSLLVVGPAETIGTHRRIVTLNCIPESQFHIAEVDHDDYVTIGSSATYRRVGTISDVQTGITFTVEEGPDWVYESAFDILVGGERMTVTSIAAASGTYPARTQVWTVTRSVNGVVKAHPNDVRVELFYPAHIGL